MSDVSNETQDERTRAERREAERESMRTNPEVMGRKEPINTESVSADERARESGQPRAERIARTDRPVERTERTDPTVRTAGTVEKTERPVEQMSFWPQMGEFRQRLDGIQSEFINEPRAAVQKAERLVEEAVDHMAKSMREQMKRMHGDLEGNADTEKLRLLMRSYRMFIESLDSRRAA
jgi:hypothetical protein